MRLISLVLTPLLVFLGQGCVDDPAETATLAPTADGSSSTGSDSATSTSGGDTDTDTSTTGQRLTTGVWGSPSSSKGEVTIEADVLGLRGCLEILHGG